jgi:ATP-dependent RNA helicase DDX19/DBP5
MHASQIVCSRYTIISTTELTICRLLPNLRQILLFSATFPDDVLLYAQQFCPQANEIRLKRDELTIAGIKQMFMDCPSGDGKYEVLSHLYGLMTIGSSIIFVKVNYSVLLI